MLYFRDWEDNDQHVQDHVRDRITKVDRFCWQTVVFFRLCGSPVGLEIGTTKKEQGKEVSNRPCDDDRDHRPIHPSEPSRNSFGKYTSIEEKKAQFDAS